MKGCCDLSIGAGPVRDAMQRIGRSRCGVDLDLGAEAGRSENPVSCNGVLFNRTDKILAPLLDLAGVRIHPVKMRLEVAVRTGDIAEFDREKDVPAVRGPAQMPLDGLVLSNAARLSESLGGRCDGREVQGVDLDVLAFLLTLVDGVAQQRQAATVG